MEPENTDSLFSVSAHYDTPSREDGRGSGIICSVKERTEQKMKVSAEQVKILREKTGAGVMDCREALVQSAGNLASAEEWLKKQGIIRSVDRSGNITSEGIVRAVVRGNRAVIVEICCQSAYAARTAQFAKLADTAAEAILRSGAGTAEEAMLIPTEAGILRDYFAEMIALFRENITLRRFAVLSKEDDEIFGDYVHQGGRVAALCVLSGTDDREAAHHMAMQVAAMNPSYISRDDIPEEILEKQYEIQQAAAANDMSLAGKPEKVRAYIIEGRVSKSLKDLCLMEQEYFLDLSMKCSDYLKNCGASVRKFVRYAAGEDLEK